MCFMAHELDESFDRLLSGFFCSGVVQAGYPRATQAQELRLVYEVDDQLHRHPGLSAHPPCPEPEVVSNARP